MLGAEHGENADVAALYVRHQRGGKLHHALDATAEQIDDRLAFAERHVDDLGAAGEEQRGGREMGVAAGAGIADAQLAGIGLGVIDELLQRLPRRVGAHRDHRRLDAHPRDGVERLVVERQDAGVIVGRDRVRVPDDGVAVRLLLLDVAVADRAPAAGAIHHRHRHAQRFRHALSEIARGDVGSAAGAEHHRHLDRPPAGKFLCVDGARDTASRGYQDGKGGAGVPRRLE